VRRPPIIRMPISREGREEEIAGRPTGARARAHPRPCLPMDMAARCRPRERGRGRGRGRAHEASRVQARVHRWLGRAGRMLGWRGCGGDAASIRAGVGKDGWPVRRATRLGVEMDGPGGSRTGGARLVDGTAPSPLKSGRCGATARQQRAVAVLPSLVHVSLSCLRCCFMESW